MLESSLSLPDTTQDVSAISEKQTSVEINIIELPDQYQIEAKVPGFTKKEIDISFKDNCLIIEGSTSIERKTNSGKVITQEFTYSSFKRNVNLPSKVDIDKAEAELKNGIMTITIPKLPEVLKKIDIK